MGSFRWWYLFIAVATSASVATSGFMSRPVENLRSSMAFKLSGSAIAMCRSLPSR